jgi:hypothetical protein
MQIVENNPAEDVKYHFVKITGNENAVNKIRILICQFGLDHGFTFFDTPFPESVVNKLLKLGDKYGKIDRKLSLVTFKQIKTGQDFLKNFRNNGFRKLARKGKK